MLVCPLILSGQLLLFIDLMADVEPFYSVLTDVLTGLVADLIAKLLRADVIAPNNSKGPKTHIVVPYHQGLSESYKRTCKKYGIEVHLKGGHTIKDLLMAPKDKDPILKEVGSYTDLNVAGLTVIMNT